MNDLYKKIFVIIKIQAKFILNIWCYFNSTMNYLTRHWTKGKQINFNPSVVGT